MVPSESAPKTPKPKSHGNAFVYQFNIGDIEAWSISDGHMLFNDKVDKMWPPADRPAMVEQLQQHGERTEDIGLEGLAPVVVVRVPEAAEHVLEGGHLDEGVDRAEPVLGSGNEGRAGVGVGDVGGHG